MTTRLSHRRKLFLQLTAIVIVPIALAAFSLFVAWTRAADLPASWEEDTPLLEARSVFGMVANQGHLFVVAGQTTNDDILSTVGRSPVNLPLGAWQSDKSLPGPLFLHGTAAHGNHLYVVGGWDGRQIVASSYAAEVDQNGNIRSWNQTNPLPGGSGRSAFGFAMYRRAQDAYLYAVGGWDGYRPTRSVYRARVQGSNLVWDTLSDLPRPLYRVAALVVPGNPAPYLYVVGGHDGTGRSAKVYRAQLNAEGGIAGNWEESTPLPQAREFHAAVIYRDHLAVIGGRDANGNGTNTVYSAAINGDGSLGAWGTNTLLLALPKPLDRHAAVVVTDVPNCGEVIYVAGGRSNNEYQRTVYRSKCTLPTPTATPTSTRTNTPTPTRTSTPTATPTGVWAAWREPDRVILLPRDGSADVALDYYNAPANTKLLATLTGTAAVFKETGLLSYEASVEGSGIYTLTLKAITNATPGANFTLGVQIGNYLLPARNGSIPRTIYLPVILRNWSPSSTPTPTATSSCTMTPTPSRTLTATLTRTPTLTHTPTATHTPTVTSTPKPTNTNTPTATPSPSQTPTVTVTKTTTLTHTPTATSTPSQTPTATSTSTVENTIHLYELVDSSAFEGIELFWTARVRITVHDFQHKAVEGAEVSGRWSDGIVTTDGTCITNPSGGCNVEKETIPFSTESVTFKVDKVVKEPLTYVPDHNHYGDNVVVHRPTPPPPLR